MAKTKAAPAGEKEIVKRLKKADQAYYNAQEPVMTDAAYDAEKDRLRALHPASSYLSQVGTPPDSNAFEKVRLVSHMGSQLKIQTIEEAKEWFDKHQTLIFASHKMDGSSVELIYEKGLLVRAATRGDGTVGQDITRNARLWRVPDVIPMDGYVVVRGEAILSTAAWKAHFADTANPRNAGNGTILRLDGAKNEHIHFVAFDVHNVGFPQHSAKWTQLQMLGFEVVPAELLETWDELLMYYRRVEAGRDNLQYLIDGVVLAIDDLEKQRELGFAEGGSKPKGQVAWKFPAKGAETTLIGIEVNVGSTGALVPTGILDPVEVGGVVIKRVTLNNFDFIREMDLNLSDRVMLMRANDVIPQIVKVVEKNLTGHFPEPTECPACGGKVLLREEKGRVLRCANPECCGKRYAQIMNWIQKTKIENIGDALLEALMDDVEREPLVQDIIDLYTLVPAALENLQVGDGGRLGPSMAAKVVESIHDRRKMPIHVLLGSLSIPFLGRRMAQKIGLQTIAEWLSVTEAELATKDGMGPNKAREMHRGIQAIADTLIRPLQKIVQIEHIQQPTMNTSGKLAGKAFVFTGIRPTPEEQAALAALGGSIKDSVSKNSTHLVQKERDSESSKSRKAKDLGQQVISYEDFQELIA